MKQLFHFAFCCLSFSLSAQKPTATNIYSRIKNYYLQNPQVIEYAEDRRKNAASGDTTPYIIAYAKNIAGNSDSYATAWLSDEKSVGLLFLHSINFYLLSRDKPQKIKVKKGESLYWTFAKFPSHNIDRLEETFGTIKSVEDGNGYWLVSTNKYLISVDTNNYRIAKLFAYQYYKDKVGFDDYTFVVLSDSIQVDIKRQMNNLVQASETRPEVTRKDIEKKREQPEKFKGTQFPFKGLSPINNVKLDSSLIKGKYIIYDFFYQACFPCQQMTDSLLNWLQHIDTSKLELVGINPFDDESLMKDFIVNKKVNYPIVIGEQAKQIVEHYKVYTYPTLFLVAPDGMIKMVQSGASESFLRKVERLVNKQ